MDEKWLKETRRNEPFSLKTIFFFLSLQFVLLRNLPDNGFTIYKTGYGSSNHLEAYIRSFHAGNEKQNGMSVIRYGRHRGSDSTCVSVEENGTGQKRWIVCYSKNTLKPPSFCLLWWRWQQRQRWCCCVSYGLCLFSQHSLQTVQSATETNISNPIRLNTYYSKTI